MNYYKRAVLDEFKAKLKPNKVLVLLGARRVGKTQLIKKYLETTTENILQLNGEDIKMSEFNVLLQKVEEVLYHKFKINHINIQPEYKKEDPKDFIVQD